jgi:hypothetical protein
VHVAEPHSNLTVELTAAVSATWLAAVAAAACYVGCNRQSVKWQLGVVLQAQGGWVWSSRGMYIIKAVSCEVWSVLGAVTLELALSMHQVVLQLCCDVVQLCVQQGACDAYGVSLWLQLMTLHRPNT